MELLLIIAVIVFIFWYNKVKKRRIIQLYSEARNLKITVKADGDFIKSPYSSRKDFLDYMGHFFKYKKHEWIFIAFMQHGIVDKFWLNKGFDNRSVSYFLDDIDIKNICKTNSYNHILVGHNHPAGALAPSKQDRISLEKFMDSMAEINVSVEDLVFVAGNWKKYGLSIGQHFRRLFQQ